MLFGIKGVLIAQKSPFLPPFLSLWGCGHSAESTPNCIPNCISNPVLRTKRALFPLLPYPCFYPSGAWHRHSHLIGILNTAKRQGAAADHRVHGRIALYSPLPCRPTGTMPRKRRKRLNFAPSASFWAVGTATQRKRPHSWGKPAMQPHAIKDN